MPPGNRRVTLTDVAAAAGVSKSTASRALLHQGRISQQTIEKVDAAAAAMGYVRDLRAAELRGAHGGAVGLLVRSSELAFYGQAAAHLQRVAEAQGLRILIVNGGDSAAAQVRGLETLLGHRVSGIIIVSGRTSLTAARQAARFVPTILLGAAGEATELDSVSIAVSSEVDLAQRVLDAGHRKVAVVQASHPLAYTLRARTQTFAAVLGAGGAEIFELTDDENTPLEAQLKQRLDAGVSAVMAGNDETAVRVLEELRRLDVRCPETVSVTGFDGVGVYATPLLGLTTVTQPVEQLATEAIGLLKRREHAAPAAVERVEIPGGFVPGRTLGTAY